MIAILPRPQILTSRSGAGAGPVGFSARRGRFRRLVQLRGMKPAFLGLQGCDQDVQALEALRVGDAHRQSAIIFDFLVDLFTVPAHRNQSATEDPVPVARAIRSLKPMTARLPWSRGRAGRPARAGTS